jgi:hypothetical protein
MTDQTPQRRTRGKDKSPRKQRAKELSPRKPEGLTRSGKLYHFYISKDMAELLGNAGVAKSKAISAVITSAVSTVDNRDGTYTHFLTAGKTVLAQITNGNKSLELA